MANTNFRKFVEGIRIVPKTTSATSAAGDMDFDTTNNRLNLHNGTTASPVVTIDHSATLLNKTIDANSNTIQNLDNATIASGAAIDATKLADGSVSNTEFQYINSLTSNAQDQINTTSGDISSLQTDLSNLTTSVQTHISGTSGVHGTSGDVVGTTDAQILTNKTLVGTSTYFKNDVDSSISIEIHPAGSTLSQTIIQGSQTATRTITLPDATTTLVGTDNSVALTNKTISGSSNTLSNIPNSATTADSANTNSAIVARDSSGNFSTNKVNVATGGAGGIDITGVSDLYIAPSLAANKQIIIGGGSTNSLSLNGGSLTTDAFFDLTISPPSGKKAIIATANNANIELTPNGTGFVDIDNLTLSDNTITTQSGALNLAAVSGSKVIVATAGNANIELTPNGSGIVDIDNLTLSDNTITTQSGDLNLAAVSGSKVVVATAGNGNIELTPNGTGIVDIDNLTLSDNTITTQSGDLNLAAVSGSKIIVASAGNANIELTPNGTGIVDIDNISLSDNTITTQSGDLTINAFSNRVVVGSTSLKLPTGTSDPSGIAGGDTFYNTSSGKLRVYSGSTWGDLSGSGSTGLKNYITSNPDIELGSTTGFSLGTATLTSNFPSGAPTFGSGASGTLSISASSSSPLAGTYSLLYADSAATTAGNFVATSALTLDSEAQGQVLGFKFAYNASSGSTNINMSGTSSNSYGVAFYDVTNSAWLQPAGVYNLVQKTGVGFCTGTLQIPITCASIRMVVYNANATAGAATLKLDDFFLGPQVQVAGAAIGDWTSYTPTLSNLGTSPSLIQMYYRRVGDSYEIQGRFRTGTSVPGTTPSFTLPNGASVDTTKISSNSTMVGKWGRGLAAATDGNYGGDILVDPAIPTSLFFTTGNNAKVLGAKVTVASDVMNSSEDQYFYAVKAPIVGLSSQTVMSNDTDTRVVSFAGTKSATQAVTANTTDITFVAAKDTHGGWSGSVYTIPVSGDYQISGLLADNAANTWNAAVYVDGVFSRTLLCSVSGNYGSGAVTIPSLRAGQTVSLRIASSITISGNAGQHFSISRISGPATIAATESVNARYFSATASLSGSDSTITYSTKDFDSHNAYSGGTYTIPVSGKYQINAHLVTVDASGVYAAGISIYKNGVQVTQSFTGANSVASAGTADVGVSDIVSFLAGDALTIKALNSGTTPTVVVSSVRNVFSIARVGN